MPNITVTLREGRSTEDFRELVERLTAVTVETLGVAPEKVGVQIIELSPERMARGGRLASDQ